MSDNRTTKDDALAEAMRAGDQEALGCVIERYTPYVGTVIWNIVGGTLSKADAEEIVSETFCTLWFNADKIRRGKLKTYLSSIARSRALNALRGQNRETALEDDRITISISGPEDTSIREEEYAALRRTIDGMPEPDRTIFLRHYFYYQKTADIARAMEINVNTVQSKLRRGRESLYRELTKGGYFLE